MGVLLVNTICEWHGWTRSSGHCWIVAEHCNARPKFGPSQRDHMFAKTTMISIVRHRYFEKKTNLPNVLSNNLSVRMVGVEQDELDEVITVLIPSNYLKVNNCPHTRKTSNLLSISGMRGRSGRASQTFSRYRSRKSPPATFRHFSTTLDAN